jgi:hypothetical protein
VLTVLAEAGGDGVPVEAGQRVPARVHEPRRQPGEHLQEGFRGCCVASRALLAVFFAVVDDWMLREDREGVTPGFLSGPHSQRWALGPC